MTRQRPSWLGKAVGAALAAVVALAIGVTTTYTTAAEGAAVAAGLNPDKTFDPAAKAAELFPVIQKDLPGKAVDITTFDQEASANLAEAAKKYGQDLGAGSYAVPLLVKGKVSQADAAFVTIEVAGVSKPVVMPVGGGLSGGPVRDALGIIKFGDVPDQIAFQSLAQEIKKLMKAQVVDKADPASLTGKSVTVYGAWASTSPKIQWTIQPVSIEVTG